MFADDWRFHLSTNVPYTKPPITPDEALNIEIAFQETLEAIGNARRILCDAASALYQDAGAMFDYKIDDQETIARDIWRAILESHPITLFMSEKRRKAFLSEQDKKPLPLNARAILSKMTELEKSVTYFLQEWAAELAKSPKGQKGELPQRFTVAYAINWSGRSFSLSYQARDWLRELDRFMHVLDNRPQPLYEMCDSGWLVKKKMPLLSAIDEAGKTGVQRGETDYFRFYAGKKDALSLAIKRRDLYLMWNTLDREHLIQQQSA